MHEYLETDTAIKDYIKLDDGSLEDGIPKFFKIAHQADVIKRIGYRANERGAAPVQHSKHDDGLHVGSGIDHMTAMVQLAEDATTAGVLMPHMLVRDENDVVVPLFFDNEAREMVTAASHQKNRYESAKNILRVKFNALQVILKDPNGGLDATATYAEKATARKAALDESRRIHAEIDAEARQGPGRVRQKGKRPAHGPRPVHVPC